MLVGRHVKPQDQLPPESKLLPPRGLHRLQGEEWGKIPELWRSEVEMGHSLITFFVDDEKEKSES